jgi:hypothetical protein
MAGVENPNQFLPTRFLPRDNFVFDPFHHDLPVRSIGTNFSRWPALKPADDIQAVANPAIFIFETIACGSNSESTYWLCPISNGGNNNSARNIVGYPFTGNTSLDNGSSFEANSFDTITSQDCDRPGVELKAYPARPRMWIGVSKRLETLQILCFYSPIARGIHLAHAGWNLRGISNGYNIVQFASSCSSTVANFASSGPRRPTMYISVIFDFPSL